MNYANETLFLVFALVLAGLFVSTIPYFSKRAPSKTNQYWLLAIGLDILAFLLFASVSAVGPILLTFANTFSFSFFFVSLTNNPSQKL
jgi:phosphatidylserine synthase